MNKRFTSYNELVKERERLEMLLQAQKEVIRLDVEEIKLKLQPVKNAMEFVKKITTRDKIGLLFDVGSDIAIYTFIRNFVLARAGWLVKLAVPFFLKNFSTHVIAEHKWLEKLKHWLGIKDRKDHEEEEEKEEEMNGSPIS